jgi:acetolactate synthase-1/3 small subunit
MVLSVIEIDAAETAMGRLQKLQDVYGAEMIPPEGQSAYALILTTNGNVGLVGGAAQVDEIIERSRSEKYVMALNAL